ncbi:uncharacterized protein BTUAT1_18120 [Bacillus altitudinis]|nr:uncharacterized protein BTUAT1_18120 [Bacillus pumilus]BDC55123.1 hypothetical protein TM2_17920 [Bacillus altitudinis]
MIFCNEAAHDIYRKRDICDRIDCTNCPSPKIDISFYVRIFKSEVKPRKFIISKIIESNHLKVKSFYVMVLKE